MNHTISWFHLPADPHLAFIFRIVWYFHVSIHLSSIASLLISLYVYLSRFHTLWFGSITHVYVILVLYYFFFLLLECFLAFATDLTSFYTRRLFTVFIVISTLSYFRIIYSMWNIFLPLIMLSLQIFHFFV